MIPRLLKSDATDFTKLGYGALLKTTECKVTESLTDSPTLEMLLLDDDELTRYLEVGSIITAEPNKRDVAQAFVVEEIKKPIDGIISIYATHIAQHRAKLIPVSTFTASTLDNALTAVVSNSMETNPFTLVRDSGKNNVTATMTTTVPHSLRELMGGMEGSILDIYRGEWGYDNFTLTLYNKRGRDNGVQVMYSRNMTDFNLDEIFDWDNSITGVIGYWKSEDGATTVISDIQYSSNATDYPYKKTICMDFTDRFESQPTKAQLDTYCSNWISSRGLIGATVDVAFDHLDIQNGEDIGLGDTVHIYNARYNLDMESRIIGTVYNVLRDEFETITIGDMKTTLSEAIQGTVGDTGGMSSGSVEPSSTTPAMDGVANVGSEGKYARGDHVHPTDSSRLAALNGTALNPSLKWAIGTNTDANSYPRVEFRRTSGANTPLVLIYYEDSSTNRYTKLVDETGVAFYPIGAVICTDSNTNPSATYGGTWSLVDKFFTEYTSSTTSLITPQNCTVTSLSAVRDGMSATLRLQLALTASLGESSVDLATIPFSVFGVSGFYTWYGVGWTDGGNGIAMLQATANNTLNTVTLQSVDVVTKTSGGSIPSGNTLSVFMQPTIRQGNMLDSVCNKFLWRRTA